MATGRYTVSLSVDTSEATAAIEDLETFLMNKPSLARRVDRLFDFPDFAEELFVLDADDSVTNKSELRSMLKPTEHFHFFFAAVQAGNIDAWEKRQAGHEFSSSG